MQLSPLPPTAPPALTDMRNVCAEQLVPTFPHRVYAVTSTGLPPAADHTYCDAWVIDLNVRVTSDGTSWIRNDTGVSL